MNFLDTLTIDQPYIALFGSGNSINEMSDSEFQSIKANCFTITVNYAPLKLNGHMNMWSDRKVSDFLESHYTKNPKECLFLTQENRVSAAFKRHVEYWFNRRKEGLKGNYTVVWALQLLQKYFPNKTILLFGVDMYAVTNKEAKWYDNYTDYDLKKRGQRYNVQSKLDQCAKQIAQYISAKNVYNCNLKSQLDYFEKCDWKKMFSLKILHLCHTPLAGAPAHLSKILNKYTAAKSTSVLRTQLKSRTTVNLRWDYDVVSPTPTELQKLVQDADILHHHRKEYAANLGQHPAILQYHSQPNGYTPLKTQSNFNGKKLVIAQYHPRFYTDAKIVPNMIDIWDEMYKPGVKDNKVIKIFFSWATEVKGGWGDKGSAQTKAILDRIKKKYGAKVAIVVKNNRPYEECMAEKQTAHICIDECVTGSYHLQSLEGCAVGAATLNNIDTPTTEYIKEVTGKLGHPFIKTSLDQLFDRISHLIDHPDELKETMATSRKWMEENWDPKILVHKFLQSYYNVLNYGTVVSPKNKNIGKRIAIPEAKPSKSTLNKRAVIIPKREKKVRQVHTVRPKSPVPKPTSRMWRPNPKEGLPLSNLHTKHLGEDIYIFGCGPSLFHANPDDYKDKICFGINFAGEIMPHIDYHHMHVIEVYEALKDKFDNSKFILPQTLVRQWYRDRRKNIQPNRIPSINPKAFLYPIQDPAIRNIHQKNVSIERETEIFTWSTTAHSAIHIAAYMGAKNIYLIGMDYAPFTTGKIHFNSQFWAGYGEQDWNANSKHKQGDDWLAKHLIQEGVNVVNLSKQISRQPRREATAL